MNRGPRHTLHLFLFSITLLAAINLGAESVKPVPTKATARIEWNHETCSLIQSNGYYARIIRLQNRQLVCGFDFERKIWIRHSNDEGKTWQPPIQVAEWPAGRLTNTELLQLHNGSLLCFYNERPHNRAAPPGEKLPYAIRMTRSENSGRTWKPPQTLYTAGVEFTNGCWEPAAIELPSREIQVVFANEGPYRTSDEQEITLLRSHNGAKTWKPPVKVSFCAGTRDGMPVPLVLQNRRGIVFAIEDNCARGAFKPYIVFTSLRENWRDGFRGPGHTNRWSALREPLAPQVYGGAPYLRQMPTGEILLSYQRSESGELNDAYMEVCVGNDEARNFTNPTRPFPDGDKPQLWNSLFVKDKQTVMAISETSLKGVHGIWSVEGKFVRK